MKKFNFDILPKDAAKVVARLRGKDLNFWIVGGFVRDWLAGLKPSDIDMAAVGSPWGLKKLLHGQLIECRHTIVTYGNVQITPLRKGPLNLSARDFTVNAIAIDEKGKLVDPFGGRVDASARVFRALSRQGLYDDPVRMLRGCRLAARLGWKIEEETAQCFTEFAKKDAVWKNKKLKSRLGLELRKAFDDMQPSRFLALARRYGLLVHLFPLLNDLWQKSPDMAQQALAECDAVLPGQCNERLGVLLKYAAFAGEESFSMKAYNFLMEIRWHIVAGAMKNKKESMSADDLAFAMLAGKRPCNDPDFLLQACKINQKKATITGICEAGRKIFGRSVNQEELDGACRILKETGRNPGVEPETRRNALRLLGWDRQKIKKLFCGEK